MFNHFKPETDASNFAISLLDMIISGSTLSELNDFAIHVKNHFDNTYSNSDVFRAHIQWNKIVPSIYKF